MPPTVSDFLISQYGCGVRRIGNTCLLPASETLRFLDDYLRGSAGGVRFRFLEAFRLHEAGGIQPAMEYSDPTPESVERYGGVVEAVRALVVAGSANGYEWFEVYVDDNATGESSCVGCGL